MKPIARSLMMFTVILTGFLTGCATVENNRDPIEPVNRVFYQMNKGLDTVVLRPLAMGYDYVMPGQVKKRVSNAYWNITEPRNIVNNILQWKLEDALHDTVRFVVNSSLGIGGLHDVAAEIGLERHNEDFGQTLGVWGMDNPGYLVLPLLGPTTFRDAPAKIPDMLLDPKFYIKDMAVRASIMGVGIIEKRAKLLSFDDVLKQQVDEYAFVRDSYMQNRRSLVNDSEDADLDGFEFVEDE